jgi:hypothetical protein
MQPDVGDLLCPGTVVDPAGPLGAATERLIADGIASGGRRRFAYCANPNDYDFVDVLDASCPGRVAVPDEGLDDWAWCPCCDRRLETSRKETFELLVMRPTLPALLARLAQLLGAAGQTVREQPEGALRVERDGNEAGVVLVDACSPHAARVLIEQGAIAVAADIGRARYQVPRDRVVLSAGRLLLVSPEPLLAAVKDVLSGSPAPLLVPPQPVADTAARRAPIFPLPPGARWGDVTIYAVDGATVGICEPGARPVHASAVDLGMAKTKARNPAKRFKLLVHLCMNGGQTDWKRARTASDPLVFDNFAAFKMQAIELRRDLQDIFGLQDDPYTSFGEHKPLTTAFKAIPEAPGRDGYQRPLS